MRLPCLLIECFVNLLGLFKDSLARGSEGGGAAHVDRAGGRCTKGAKVTGKTQEGGGVRFDLTRRVSRRGRERSPGWSTQYSTVVWYGC